MPCLALSVSSCFASRPVSLDGISLYYTHSSTPILGFSHGLKAPHSPAGCDNKLPCLVLSCLVLSCFVCLDLPCPVSFLYLTGLKAPTNQLIRLVSLGCISLYYSQSHADYWVQQTTLSCLILYCLLLSCLVCLVPSCLRFSLRYSQLHTDTGFQPWLEKSPVWLAVTTNYFVSSYLVLSCIVLPCLSRPVLPQVFTALLTVAHRYWVPAMA